MRASDIDAASRLPDGRHLAGGVIDRFYCSRCGYSRPLKPGEDGLQVYILHEKRCNPACGRQLWLPCITEDELGSLSSDQRGSTAPVPRLGHGKDRDEPRRVATQPATDSRKAA